MYVYFSYYDHCCCILAIIVVIGFTIVLTIVLFFLCACILCLVGDIFYSYLGGQYQAKCPAV